jgi:CheY-like chemotaxis protein
MTVRLPLTDGVAAPQDVADSGPPRGTAHRILVVDDNADAAASLAMLLELDGHETRVAHSGTEALTVVAEFAPRFVFLDIGLPDITGYDVARRLRAMPGLEPMPRLIALTGWGQEEDRARSREAGFVAHLVKPVDPAELGAALV